MFRKDTGKYQGAVVVGVTARGNPRRIKKSFLTKAEAVAWVNDRIAELHHGMQLDQNPSLYETYDAWMQHGISMRGWQRATIDSYSRILERLVLPHLGHMRVRDISATTIRKLLQSLADGEQPRNANRRKRGPAAMKPPKAQGPAGIKRAYAYLSLVLNDAVRMGLIQTNPARQVTPPTPPEPGVQRWSEDEMASIVRVALTRDDQVCRYALIGLGTGMRTEELLGLTWDAVDLDQRMLWVEQVATSTGPKTVRVGGKSRAALRPLPFDEITAAAFERQRAYVLELPRIRTEENLKRAEKGKPPLPWADHDLVFCTRYGTVLDRTTLRRQYNHLQDDAGVKRIKLYSTRSTHLSTLADAGTALHTLSERAGHTDRYFTAKHYARGSNAAHRRAAEAFGTILAAAGRGSSGADGKGKPSDGEPDVVSRADGQSRQSSSGTQSAPDGL